jgi:diguanylate cyclase (GGDEF)-like protein
MRLPDLRRHRATSLRTRVLLLIMTVFVAVAVPAYVAFEWIVKSTIIQLGTLFAEKQVLFDRYRGLDALLREVSLAETLVGSATMREWAEDEFSPDKRDRALAELERFRAIFGDHSYFFIINDSGNYYFNDRDNSYAGAQKRYAVRRDNPRDGWYFTTIASGPGCKLNVDHDDTLDVTKVWINCVVMDGPRVLGALGTGVDLTQFIREVVDVPQVGVQSMFVDRNGAIQAHRDPRMVDFHSLTKDTKSKRTVFQLLDRPADQSTLAAMMAEVSSGGNKVVSRFLHMGGRDVLVGVGYLDRIGWFNVTLMDVDQIIDSSLFKPIAALLAAMMAAAAILVTLLFKRRVLDRLERVEAAVARVEGGDFAAAEIDQERDEIGRLSRGFARMAESVGNHTQLLEAAVEARTEQLERIANIDPLTEVWNRRGFLGAFVRERNRAGRAETQLGLLLIDMDNFKTINDAFGHHGGDAALAEAARRLTGIMRNYDACGRWGGDEFIMLIANCDAEALEGVARRIVAAVTEAPIRLGDGQDVRMTISIGACLMQPDEAFDAVAAKTDAALYAAKRAGRDRVVIFDPALHGVAKAVRRA